MPAPQISVCILAGHGGATLDACLECLQAQSSPPSYELLVGGNLTPEVLSVVRGRFPTAHLCETGGRLPGAARNPLIERATGDLLLFLDDDVTAPPDLLKRLSQTAARHPQASVFGGPNDTPPHSTHFQVVQGAVLSSIMGAGPVSRRYGARHPGPADERWFTLCNLAVRRDVMLPFVSHLVCAEENALLAELRRRGERMRYEPDLRVFHARRPRLSSFAAQMFKYGRGRGELLARRPSTFRAAYVVPSLLLTYLVALPLMIAVGGQASLMLAPLALYCCLTVATALRVAWTLRRIDDAPLAAGLTVTVHACYGAGVLRGLLLLKARRKPGVAEWISTSSEPAETVRLPGEARGAQRPPPGREAYRSEG
jgi:succinoglycan biosynthesis protein ExoA